jgi:Bacterial alpha-L-rhamnosidase 6 hairpin glycosidase domain
MVANFLAGFRQIFGAFLKIVPKSRFYSTFCRFYSSQGSDKCLFFLKQLIQKHFMAETIVVSPRLVTVSQTQAAAEADFKSQYLAVGLSRRAPAFSRFAVDSLGRGKLGVNPILPNSDVATVPGVELAGNFNYTYSIQNKPVWKIQCQEKALVLSSEYVTGMRLPPFTLTFNQKANHATLLGLMKPGERRMSLPCVLHLPDMGSVRITCNIPGATLDYDARRFVETLPFVHIAFPPANPTQRRIEYRLEIVMIHPSLPGIETNPLYDGFRRDFLNIFQVNPRLQMLANNASSDACTFTVFEYSAVARFAPPLAEGLTCLDLVRMTLDRYFSGAKGYGQTGYACTKMDADLVPWVTPWTSLDSLPSLLIAACDYAEGAADMDWAKSNYANMAAVMREMLAGDGDGDGLLEYPGTGNFGDRPLAERRPSNWWDTINFGHKDAFANAIAYHAMVRCAGLARQLGQTADAESFARAADKMRAAYVPTFLNPATGLLAGWKSADGQLHDYWFTFVQGLAITYGLVDDQTANAIMDRLLAKMKEVGYANFRIGLPGNLVPVKKNDYVYHDTPPEVHGVPLLEDGSDGFEFYENGGATGCWAYYTVKALYQLGRVEDARRIFHPMLRGYAAGEFQGFGENGMSRDWRDWKGGCHGYEGLLVDNYLTLLAVLDDVKI